MNKILFLILVILASCSTTASKDTLVKYTAGAVPCGPEEIEIVDASGATGTAVWNWKAKCDGIVYNCNMAGESSAQCRARSKK